MSRWTSHSSPFPHATSDRALPDSELQLLQQLFAEVVAWEEHDSFYKASIAHVAERVPPAIRARWCAEAAELTGEPLLADCRVTFQRMAPGQGSEVHSDRPLLGFEAARWVIHLNEWSPGDGGELGIHSVSQRVGTRPPRLNSGFCFVMYPESLHSVAPTTVERQTMVVHFFHRGNPPQRLREVNSLLNAMNLGELSPRVLELMDEYEPRVRDDQSLAALWVAWILHVWGEDAGAGYRAVVTIPRDDRWWASISALPAPILLAAWVARVRLDYFDPREWRSVVSRVEGYKWRGEIGRKWYLALTGSDE